MTLFKNKYRVESNRWRYWDYNSPGYYFLTVCTRNRECIFGEIIDGKMILSPAGKILRSEIEKIPSYHPNIILDEWIIMPNHIHLLIEITDFVDVPTAATTVVSVATVVSVEEIHEFPLPKQPQQPQQPPQQPQQPPQQPQPKRPNNHIPWWHNPNYKPNIEEIKQYRRIRRKMIIPKIMGKLKMLSSKQINILNETPGRQNWQSNYHDHVIKNSNSYMRIKNYIINNPKNWKEDKFWS